MEANDCLDELQQAHREIATLYEERDRLASELQASHAECNELTDRAVKAEHSLEVAYDTMDGFCQEFCFISDKCKGCPIGEHEKECANKECENNQ